MGVVGLNDNSNPVVYNPATSLDFNLNNKNIREFHHLQEFLILYFHEQLLFQMFPVTYEEIRYTLQQLLCRMFLDDVQKDYHG